jgi:cytochrome o ubiquinol oxidase subunit IV
MNNWQSSASSGSYLTYTIGFMLSLALTSTAFWLVHRHLATHHLSPSDAFALTALAVLAILQLTVQLIFFLHLDRQSKPWWNTQVLVFAVGTVIILVGGSIWIMTNLGYHHGPRDVTHTGHTLNNPAQTNQYIIQDEGISP